MRPRVDEPEPGVRCETARSRWRTHAPLRRVISLALLLAVADARAESLRGVPPSPPPPASFLAPADDPAGRVARILAKRFQAVPNQRAQVPGQWIVDPSAVWQIRPQAACFAELERLGLRTTPQAYTPVPIPAPVVLQADVGGVVFRKTRPDAPFIVSCELAARLPDLARVVRRYGVTVVDVLSSYRREPLSSYHTVGMGLDLVSFQTDRGELNVEQHFAVSDEPATCYAPDPADWRARALLDIACDLVNTHRFATVITPSYGRGHEDHFHLDIRPDDPRIYVR
jgi:hypothetical protein